MSLHILDFYLFIYGCPVSSLMCAGLLSLQQVGTTALCCGVWASHCGVLSHCRARALGVWAELWITGPAALPHVGSSQTRDPTCVLCIGRQILNHWGCLNFRIKKNYTVYTVFLSDFFHFSQSAQSVMSDSLRPHGLQHTRPSCPSPTPRVYSNSCPLSWWCHPTISSSVVPFFSCLQSFPTLGSFHESALHIRWPKYWSFSFSISPSNEQSGLISGRISLQSKGLSRVFSNTTVQKHQFFGAQLSL